MINTAPVTMSSPDYGMQVFLFWRSSAVSKPAQTISRIGRVCLDRLFIPAHLIPENREVFDMNFLHAADSRDR